MYIIINKKLLVYKYFVRECMLTSKSPKALRCEKANKTIHVIINSLQTVPLFALRIAAVV